MSVILPCYDGCLRAEECVEVVTSASAAELIVQRVKNCLRVRVHVCVGVRVCK